MTSSKKVALLWGQYALLFGGFAALGYCSLVFLEGRHYQAWAREQMTIASSGLVGTQAGQSVRAVSRREPMPEPMREEAGNGLVGRIDIPAAHISAMVADGASPTVLRVAVGHVPGTALPGQVGNMGLAAHRDTFFRGLGELKPGDVIRVTVPGKEYVYRVRFTDIVAPNETWVLAPTSYEGLTLITCYPFHYVGSAPKRFIVRAGRSENQ